MKRILSILLALLLLMPAAYADEEKMTFHLEGARGEVGDIVTVVGSVKNAPVCASFRVIMTYDEDVLEVVEGKKINSGGLFIINVNATHEEQPAVNALAADASEVLRGDMELFSVTFRIRAETPDDGTLIQVAYQEFFKADLTRVYPIVEPCRIYTGDEQTDSQPDAPDGSEDDPAEGGSDSGSTGSDSGSSGSDSGSSGSDSGSAGSDSGSSGSDSGSSGSDSGSSGSDSGSAGSDSGSAGSSGSGSSESGDQPTGSWIIDDSSGEAIHIQDDGTTTTYTPEFSETPESGKETDVILKDQEGNNAGSLTVEKQEDGTLKVVEQNLTAKSSTLTWLLPAGIALLAAAAVAGVLLIRRKKRLVPAGAGAEEHENRENAE